MLDHDDAILNAVGDDMGRQAQPVNAERVDRYVEKFNAAALDRPDFDEAFTCLKSDKELTAAETILIAQKYRGGGAKAKTKKAALEAIERRFVEKVRTTKNKQEAARARPW